MPGRIVLAVMVCVLAGWLVWRWASRHWSLPCPSLLAWVLENPLLQRAEGTQTTLDRLRLEPGQRIVEFGPGPGRLLIPAARRVLPGGEAVGIDIQPGMIARLQQRAAEADVTNLTAILGDATRPHVEEASCDLVFLVTTLGEIPDRASAIRQAYRALKPGGRLSVTELCGDPHYQSPATVQRLAKEAGFQDPSREGRWWFFTATFVKPAAAPAPGVG